MSFWDGNISGFLPSKNSHLLPHQGTKRRYPEPSGISEGFGELVFVVLRQSSLAATGRARFICENFEGSI